MNVFDYEAALFDLDGTLIDSASVWSEIDVEFLARHGFEVPDGYLEAVRSKKFSEAAVYTISRFGLNETVEEVCAQWMDLAHEAYGTKVFLKPGALDLLLKLKERGVRLGTVTGLPEPLYSAVLRNNGVFELFDAHTSADEVVRGKESPDVYLFAADKLRAHPAGTAVFEDVYACIQSARRAGMDVFAVHDRSSGDEWNAIASLGVPLIYDFTDFIINYSL